MTIAVILFLDPNCGCRPGEAGADRRSDQSQGLLKFRQTSNVGARFRLVKSGVRLLLARFLCHSS